MGLGGGGGMSWIALVLAVCALCGEGREARARPRDVGEEEGDLGSSTTSEYLQVGRSLNLLPRYGFLTLSVKVFPPRVDNSWLFREQTAEVFEKDSYWPLQERRQNQYQHTTPQRGYDQHFLIDFCDDAKDLLTAYFDSFYIEGVPEPIRAFTSSLSVKTKAQHLGIHPTFFTDEYSFVLVRLYRRAHRATLAGNLTLSSHFKTAVSDIRVGSTESVNQFLDHYGTHIITEYEIGDVMYQVYVFGERTYGELKNNFAQSQSSQTELTQMERYFTPYYALHVGRVKLASGNTAFEKVVGEQLMSMSFFRLYQSIFTIFKHQELEDELEKLEGEVVLSLKLEKITKIIPKSPERHWLREILDNTLTLYYVTM
ncbi:hypothetical protein SK128_008289 [Halocaridina rubra]|uniref:MACPF domain-containing protein n=1 Tax=Halocaridina rubra TaxID=373956 RepID=A0AAN8WMP8_HALRR